MSSTSITPMSSLSPLTPLGATTSKPKAAATGTTSDGGLTSTTAGSTFLNLLVKELQNQDPSAPMDSTAMVGQMISLNQLDQLISINQTLKPSGTTSTSGVKADAQPASSAVLMAQQADLLNGSSTSASATSTQAAIAAASDPNSTLNLSTLNIPFGGK